VIAGSGKYGVVAVKKYDDGEDERERTSRCGCGAKRESLRRLAERNGDMVRLRMDGTAPSSYASPLDTPGTDTRRKSCIGKPLSDFVPPEGNRVPPGRRPP